MGSTPIFIAVLAAIFVTALVANVIRFTGFRNPMGSASSSFQGKC